MKANVAGGQTVSSEVSWLPRIFAAVVHRLDYCCLYCAVGPVRYKMDIKLKC